MSKLFVYDSALHYDAFYSTVECPSDAFYSTVECPSYILETKLFEKQRMRVTRCQVEYNGYDHIIQQYNVITTSKKLRGEKRPQAGEKNTAHPSCYEYRTGVSQ